MIKRSTITKVICMLALVEISAPTVTTLAITDMADTNIVQSEKLVGVIDAPTSHTISADVLRRLNALIAEYPSWASSVNYHINYVEAHASFSDKEFNDGLQKLISAAYETEDIVMESDLSEAHNVPEARNALNMAIWKAGIAYCDSHDYSLTSKLMTHAIKSGSSNPSDLNFADTYGVFKVVALEELATTVWEELTAWGATETSYTTTREFTFTSANSGLDYVMAIHACKILFNWIKHEDGSYGCLAYLTDTFDFKANPNDISTLGIANDVAVELTNEGDIGPFDITINGKL